MQGFSGEQFALNDAVATLSRIDRNVSRDDKQIIVISAADPLNLTGLITHGERIPSSGKNRIAYLQGKPVAVTGNKGLQYLTDVDPKLAWEIQNRLFVVAPSRYTQRKPNEVNKPTATH